MVLVKEVHRQILRMSYQDEASNFVEVLEGLSRVLERDVLPLSQAIDGKGSGIDAPRKALFKAGLCQMPFPSAYGGMGLPFSIYALAMELTGYADASIAMSMGIHNTVSEGVNRFGNENQRKTFVSDLISGGLLAAFSLTEPSSGSDARTMKTRATRSGNDYVLQGSKTFITNAGEADLYLVFASTSGGPSAFIVKNRTEGLSFGEDMPKLGMRGSRTSEVVFRDCRVDAANMVGEEGKGLEYVKQMLNSSRIVMAAICVGIAQHAYDLAIRYSVDREISGKAVSDFQITKEKIADMITEINAARHLYFAAARLRDMDSDYSSEAAQAKLFASETSARVCDRAIQIFGGYGYTNADVHRHWRDARLLTIGEGTSEILRLLVARKELAKLR